MPYKIPGERTEFGGWALSPSSGTNDEEYFDRYLQSAECAYEGCPWHVWTFTHMNGSFPEEYEKFCFDCAFWLQYVVTDEDGLGVVIADSAGIRDHYRLPATGELLVKDRREKFLGFGGRLMRIRYDTGHVVQTNNLWHQGTIPEKFYHLFPVNAHWASL